MEAITKPIPSERVLRPQQAWETLGAAQQAMVKQTIIRICQETLNRWRQEEKEETPYRTIILLHPKKSALVPFAKNWPNIFLSARSSPQKKWAAKIKEKPRPYSNTALEKNGRPQNLRLGAEKPRPSAV